MIKAVVFDLDDTLYPEMDYVRSGFRAVADLLKMHNGVDYYGEIVNLFEIRHEDVFDRLVSSMDIKIDKNILVQCFREHEPKGLTFYHDVMPCLEILRSQKIQTGLITDGRINGQTAKLKALHCLELFDQCLITDSLGGAQYRKPHPLPFKKISDLLKVQFSEMVYVGDNPEKDFKIRRVYPIITVKINRSDGLYGKGPMAQDETICYSIDSLSEIYNILEMNG